jgi:integrase
MKGSIKKRNHSYSVIIELDPDPVTGKRRQKWYTAHSSKEADKLRNDLLSQRDKGIYVEPRKLTVADYLNSWLTDYVQPNLAPMTFQIRVQQVNRHIIPSLGRIPLTSLKPDHLQKFYTEKLSGGRLDRKGALSTRTVHDLHGILHAALKTAVKRGLVIRNVADATDPPRFSHSEMHTLTKDDLKTVLEAAKSNPYFALFYTLSSTGLRRSEALALRVSDVNLNKATISVTRSMHRLRTGEVVFRPPKTKTSVRDVKLPQSACLILSQHKDNEEALRGILKDDDLIFAHIDGSPLLPDSVSHSWMKLVRRCGLPGIRLHDLRHTHASLMFDQGTDAKIISKRLGHSSVKVTLDIYTHPADEVQAAAAARFDEILVPRSESKAT